jgi:hypothetical protein
MANVITVQTLVDGPKNVVLKIDGVVDTSDMAVTGTIGASGFTTTIGSKTVVFVAGALVPTQGQYLTFSDTTTTFNAGTYVTSVISATSITVSNAAKATNVAAAITITGTAGNIVLIDPALLSVVDSNGTLATKLRVDRIVYDIEDLLSCNLAWEATANVSLWHLVGRGKIEPDKRFGGLQNNAGAGITGRILMTTQGWSASAVLSFSLIVDCTKQFAVPV